MYFPQITYTHSKAHGKTHFINIVHPDHLIRYIRAPINWPWLAVVGRELVCAGVCWSLHSARESASPETRGSAGGSGGSGGSRGRRSRRGSGSSGSSGSRRVPDSPPVVVTTTNHTVDRSSCQKPHHKARVQNSFLSPFLPSFLPSFLPRIRTRARPCFPSRGALYRDSSLRLST